MRLLLPALFLLAVDAGDANAQQAKGARGIEAVRRGGVVLVCRHGITGSADEDEATLRYTDPTTQRRLSAAGEKQAADVGAAIKRLRIAIGDVISSPMERAWRTGELAYGPVTLDSAWHTRGTNFAGAKATRRAEQLGRTVSGPVRVIVSHIGTIYSMMPSITGELGEGDCVVVQPRGDGKFEIVEVVPWRAWIEAR